MCFGFRDMYSAVVQSYDKSFSVQINLTLDLLRGLRRSAHYAHMLKQLFFYFFIIFFFNFIYLFNDNLATDGSLTGAILSCHVEL